MSTSSKGTSRTVKTALSLALVVGLSVYIVWRIDLPTFIEAVRNVSMLKLIPLGLVFLGASLLLDAVATSWVYRRSVAPINTKEMAIIRGASYLPSLLNHHVGQAWLTWALSRTRKVDLTAMGGATLVVYATTFGTLVALAGLGVIFAPGAFPVITNVIASVVACGLVYLLVLYLKPAALAQRALLRSAFRLGPVGHLHAMLLRLPHMLVGVLGSWASLYLFGIDLPMTDALTLLPLIMIAASLPITPAGLGTREAFAIELLLPFALLVSETQEEAAAKITAATLGWLVCVILIQLVLSLCLMPLAKKMIEDGSIYHGS